MNHQDEFNEQIRSIFVGGKIRPISWGAESDTAGWTTWSDKEKLAYAMELASAMNQAADMMQIERNKILERAEFAEEQLKNCQQALDIQKMTLTAAINNHNESRQADAKMIEDLRTRVKAQDALIKRFGDGN